MDAPSDLTVIAIDVGNSRTHVARFEGNEPVDRFTLENTEAAGAVERIAGWWDAADSACIALASVHRAAGDQLASLLRDQLGCEVYVVGDDVPVPIAVRLDPETITGIDRLLDAAAAFELLQQACVVVDAGTAVTVDFVDGEGTFHGGAIAPGATLQLRALHDRTSALPELEYRPPDDEPFGRSTAQAMLQGVHHGLRGMVWKLVERYAEHYDAYPQVIVTGGDAAALFEGDELIDRIVPDLTLRGIRLAVAAALTAGDADGDGR